MQLINIYIKNNEPDSFDIYGDFQLFQKILEDMEANGGSLIPADNWGIEIGGHYGGDYFLGKDIERYESIAKLYDERYSSMKKMMDPWVGCTGMQPISPKVIKDYWPFLKSIDYLGIINSYINEDGSLKESAKNLLITDLGTIIDLNLIYLFSKQSNSIRILEVGGGYGRLAEAALKAFGPSQVKYVLVDSVPVSLIYAYKYLSHHFPDLNIGCYYEGHEFNLDKYDCFVIPSWHFEALNVYTYDVCCNVQSMQEMNQYHVDYYLSLFDRVMTPRGMVYLSNEKDYVFNGSWNYPSRWLNLLKLRTPRSWTRNSPTEVFRLHDATPEAALIADLQYQCQLLNFDKIKELSDLVTNLESHLNQEPDIMPLTPMTGTVTSEA